MMASRSSLLQAPTPQRPPDTFTYTRLSLTQFCTCGSLKSPWFNLLILALFHMRRDSWCGLRMVKSSRSKCALNVNTTRLSSKMVALVAPSVLRARAPYGYTRASVWLASRWRLIRKSTKSTPKLSLKGCAQVSLKMTTTLGCKKQAVFYQKR